MKGNYVLRIVTCAVCALILPAACSKGQSLLPPTAAPIIARETSADTSTAAIPAWDALALLQTGENPLWFELSPGGPLLIDSPGTASLAPFAPWPAARHITDILRHGDWLVMAVNLDGFLVVSLATDAGGGGGNGNAPRTQATLYRISGGELWARYTVGSVFTWREQTAALLYRNDFFTELYPTPPRPQVFVLDERSAAPVGAEVPAFAAHGEHGEQWEAELVRRSDGGLWYYRLREKGGQNRSAYFRTASLEMHGEQISFDQWRTSDIHATAET
ncbi:MAG: hypothetical protein FWD91_06205, partial [Treponema sp.]|nr:hypothetical protein [Treponema sp.]